MRILLNLWEAISRSGYTEELSPSDKKRLILTNRLGIISVFFTFPYILAFFFGGYNSIALFSCLCCVVYFSVPLFSRVRLYTSAKLVLYMGVLVHQFVLASIFGKDAGIHIIYIALILLPIVLFEIKKQIGWIFFCGLITIFATLLLYYTGFSLFSFSVFPTKMIDALDVAYKITTVVGCFVILFSSIMVAEETEKVLDNNNLFLQYQMKAIFDNSHDAIFLADSNKREITKVNNRAIELFEAGSMEDLIGRFGLDLHKNKPSEIEIQHIQSSLQGSGFYHGEVLFKTEKENEFWGALAIKVITINSKNYHVIRITDITAQYELNAKLKSSLKEKEILLAEIHHRVKNNMAVISGLLGMQSTYAENENAKKMFEECRDRIHSMALIHDKLYQHETLARINFGSYINDLVNHIKGSYNASDSEIKFSVICIEIYLDIRHAVPCGLILNELISNAYKHAFKGREKGEVKILCTKVDEEFTMMVRDNGVGFDLENELIEPTSLGLTLINALIEQVSGKVKTKSNDGTAFFISFEV